MRKQAVTARIPDREVTLVEQAAKALGLTRSTFIRKAAVGVALDVARRIDPAVAFSRQGQAMASGLEEALAGVEGEPQLSATELAVRVAENVECAKPTDDPGQRMERVRGKGPRLPLEPSDTP